MMRVRRSILRINLRQDFTLRELALVDRQLAHQLEQEAVARRSQHTRPLVGQGDANNAASTIRRGSVFNVNCTKRYHAISSDRKTHCRTAGSRSVGYERECTKRVCKLSDRGSNQSRTLAGPECHYPVLCRSLKCLRQQQATG